MGDISKDFLKLKYCLQPAEASTIKQLHCNCRNKKITYMV